MRVVHTCLRYPPATGGVETYVREIVERTRDIEEGRDVRVLTSRMRTHGPVSELDPELLRNDPPYVQRVHHAATPLVSYPRLQALPYFLRHHQPDIVHSYSFWYQPADVAARYARKHHIPFIFHPIYYTNAVRRKGLWRLYANTIGRATFAAADVVAVISPFERSLIEEANFPVKRFELISPGVDIDEFERPHLSPFPSITGPVMLAVSRLAPGKGLEELVDAMPAILRGAPDAQLVIVGEDFGIQAALKRQTQTNGTASRIHFLGKLAREQLIGAMQHADIFVHPSHYEAFGIVVAESQAAGVPVVARNATAIPYVTAPSNKVGLFRSSDEMVQNILSALKLSDNEREKRVHQAKQHVAQYFSWDRQIKKVTELYRELVTS